MLKSALLTALSSDNIVSLMDYLSLQAGPVSQKRFGSAVYTDRKLLQRHVSRVIVICKLQMPRVSPTVLSHAAV